LQLFAAEYFRMLVFFNKFTRQQLCCCHGKHKEDQAADRPVRVGHRNQEGDRRNKHSLAATAAFHGKARAIFAPNDLILFVPRSRQSFQNYPARFLLAIIYFYYFYCVPLTG
jgi:hypothetical protein